MFYVYVLQSEKQTDQTYVGSTQDLRRRLGEHNSGKSLHTRKFLPWRLLFYAGFSEKQLAENFEKYLKNGLVVLLQEDIYSAWIVQVSSGKAFMRLSSLSPPSAFAQRRRYGGLCPSSIYARFSVAKFRRVSRRTWPRREPWLLSLLLLDSSVARSFRGNR